MCSAYNKIAKLNNCYTDVTLHFGFVSKSRDYVIAQIFKKLRIFP